MAGYLERRVGGSTANTQRLTVPVRYGEAVGTPGSSMVPVYLPTKLGRFIGECRSTMVYMEYLGV